MAATNTTNIVLVHGLWADGSSWSKVIPILQNAGHKVIAVQLPLHSLADDVATVKRAIDLVGAPVLLVGHSYGGFVITNAAYNNPNVKGLVYIAAFAPNEGQSLSNFVDTAKFQREIWSSIVEDLSSSTLRCSRRRLLKILIRLKLKLWPQRRSQPVNPFLLKNRAYQLGSNCLLGTRSLRTIMRFLLMLNACLQNKSMPLLSHFRLAMYHLCHIQMRLRN